MRSAERHKEVPMMPDDRLIRILSIEDDEGLRQCIACYLEDSGFTIEELVRRLVMQAADLREQTTSLVCFEQNRDTYKNYDPLTGLPNRALLAERFYCLTGKSHRLTLI